MPNTSDNVKHNRSERNTLIAILDEHLNQALESEHPCKLELIVNTRDSKIVGKSATRTIDYKNSSH